MSLSRFHRRKNDNKTSFSVLPCRRQGRTEKTMLDLRKGGVSALEFNNKYNLSREQSLFLAKKKWDENVYCGMKMENRAVTFPQTKTILDGVNVPSVRLDDIQAILNMRDAWRYLLKTVDDPVTLEYMCELNGYIARNEALEWGKLRTGGVCISGTDYLPPVPQDKRVEAELAEILSSGTTTEQALNVFVWGIRGQFFWDGNKRTSMTLANKILVSGGAGLLTVSDKHMERFNVLLCEFYGSGESGSLKEFLYNNAISGVEF